MKLSLILWLTGLSGSGKTTISSGVKPLLESEGYSVLVLDGDDIRSRIHCQLGFTEKDIKENNLRIAELCKSYRNDFDVIIVSIISPYAVSRSQAREILQEPFCEIYLTADLNTVMKRDNKGLYAKSQRGEIENMVGYSKIVPYEVPENPDLFINSQNEDIKTCVNNFYTFTMKHLRNHSSDES